MGRHERLEAPAFCDTQGLDAFSKCLDLKGHLVVVGVLDVFIACGQHAVHDEWRLPTHATEICRLLERAEQLGHGVVVVAAGPVSPVGSAGRDDREPVLAVEGGAFLKLMPETLLPSTGT